MKIIRINALWCNGCLVMKKVWKQVMETYPNIEVTCYDLDMDEEQAKQYNPGTLLPVAIFFDNNGKELTRLNGEHTKEEIINVIEENK